MAQEQPGAVPEQSGARSDPTGDAIAAANAGVPKVSSGTGNEGFADRVGSKQTDGAKAQQLPNLDRIIPQGAIIGAVMETALNSDLPGYARALVTKDVLSFDGSTVLIPAGSRVIGEYNSGVAKGASRIFIIWTRLIRPDGVSIALASPAVDELGRGGLGGKVNRHFLQRFGGAILLSVLTGGISAVAGAIGGGSTVVVNSSNEATSLISEAGRGNDIPPTIKTNQGALVLIFVARDLDFTAVGPVQR
jgi:type IV secretion system protein VirB10